MYLERRNAEEDEADDHTNVKQDPEYRPHYAQHDQPLHVLWNVLTHQEH